MKWWKLARSRVKAVANESGRVKDPEVKSSGQGRRMEKEEVKFWSDREITSPAEMGMVV